MLRMWILAVMAGLAQGQTKIDLASQSRRVDFTSESSTKPVKTGVLLPANCGLGEMFLRTDAAAGLGLFACTATNSWLPIGAGLSCQDSGSTDAYACNLTPGIANYTAGATYWFRANTGNTGTATVSFNGLGARAIKKQANRDLADGDIQAGQWVLVVYDGTNMQMQSQAGSVVASTSGSSVASGATLPATCATGNLFVRTTATAGNNLYACIGPDTWYLQGGTSGGGSSLMVASDGIAVGAQPTVNYVTGPGLVNVVRDTGTRVDIQLGLDTAVVQTIQAQQAGAAVLCRSDSQSATAYRCPMTPPLTSYGTGMTLNWIPDVDSQGGVVTLDVDSLGAVPVKEADGVTNPVTGHILNGRMLATWYDGSVFRLPAVSGGSSTGSGVSSGPSLPATCGTGDVFSKTGSGVGLYTCTSANTWTAVSGASGSMVYPAAGVTVSLGSAWGASLAVGTSANNLLKLDGSAKIPAVDGSQLTNLAAAASLSAAYTDWNASSGGASIRNKPTLAASATTDTTNAANISSGTLNALRLPAALANSTSVNGTPIPAASTLMTTATSVGRVQTPMTTKGDLWVTDGANMNRIAVGTDGQVITADSASTNGLRWATPTGGGSGGMSIQLDSGSLNSASILQFLNTGYGINIVQTLPSGKVAEQINVNTSEIASHRSVSSWEDITVQDVGAGSGHYAGCPRTLTTATLLAYQVISLVSTFPSSGPSDYSHCGTGALPLTRNDGTSLVTGDILAQRPALLYYDAAGTRWRMLSAPAIAPSFGKTYSFLGITQSGSNSWPLSWDSASTFTYNATDSTHITSTLGVAPGNTNTFRTVVPVFGPLPSVTVIVGGNSADTSHALSHVITYACVSSGSYDNPTFSPAATVSLTSGTGRTTTYTTFSPTCAGSSTAPAMLFLRHQPNTASFTAPFNLTDLHVVVQ